MALLFIEGWDHILDDAEANDKGWFMSGTNTISSIYSRFGGKGLDINSSDSTVAYKILSINKSTIYFGIAVKKSEIGYITAPTTGDYGIVSFRDESSVSQIRIHATPGFGLSAYRNITLLGSSVDNVFVDGKWFYLEGKIVISATVGEVTLRVNETEILNLTNQNTKNGSDYIRSIYLSAVANDRDTFFDDLYIDDSQFHGDCRIRTFMPDSDGNSADFTRSAGANDYECVDEIPPNDDTDYISSNTLNHKSIFGITTGAVGTVKAIQLNNYCRVDEAGVRKIKPIIRSNATDYQGTETAEISADYIFEHEIWELDPDDSAAWTQTKLEAAEFGLEITT